MKIYLLAILSCLSLFSFAQKDSLRYSEESADSSDFRHSKFYKYTVNGDGYFCGNCGKTRETFLAKINLSNMLGGKYFGGLEQKIYKPFSIYAEGGIIDKFYSDIHPTQGNAEIRLQGYEVKGGIRYYYGQSFKTDKSNTDLDGMYLAAEARYGKLQNAPLDKTGTFITEVQQYSARLGWQIRLGCRSYLDMNFGPVYTQSLKLTQDSNFPIKSPYYSGVRADFKIGVGIAF